MFVLVTYDVNTENEGGCRRLKNVAKVCLKYGQRVQNSVFECIIDSAQYVRLKAELVDIVDSSLDSIRFYRLGNNYMSQVEHIGVIKNIPQDSLLII